MGGELSQEEINALLNNPDGSSGENAGATSQGGSDSEQALTAEEKDFYIRMNILLSQYIDDAFEKGE